MEWARLLGQARERERERKAEALEGVGFLSRHAAAAAHAARDVAPSLSLSSSAGEIMQIVGLGLMGLWWKPSYVIRARGDAPASFSPPGMRISARMMHVMHIDIYIRACAQDRARSMFVLVSLLVRFGIRDLLYARAWAAWYSIA